MPDKQALIDALKRAYDERSLALYLGAGTSVGSGLPTWDQLVLAMYYRTLEDPQAGEGFPGLTPFPNYLYAIAEWNLTRYHEPLEVVARKIRGRYAEAEDVFHDRLKSTLYAGLLDYYSNLDTNTLDTAIAKNKTLVATAALCADAGQASPVKAVVSYNYDFLLEIALEQRGLRPQPIWREGQSVEEDKFVVYHVHGYIPAIGDGSRADEIIFTEQQYHDVGQNPYAWQNLVQLQTLATSTGLMIGLSLSDRNLRRLLDAINRAPKATRNIALLKRPMWPKPSPDEIEAVDRRARDYAELFENSGIKLPDTLATEILGILNNIEAWDWRVQEEMLLGLGIQPLWYEEHDEVAGILAAIRQ